MNEHEKNLERKKIYLHRFIAKFGSKQLIDRHKLTTRSLATIKRQVARRGYEDHLDQLMHDTNSEVREHVARYGNTKHHDHLMHDPDQFVRQQVAEFGGYTHAKILQHDPFAFVRNTAIDRLKQLGVDDE